MQTPPPLTQRMGSILTRDNQHWDRVRERLSDRSGNVGNTWTRNQCAHARFSGRSGIAVGHETGPLLVLGLNMAHITVCDTSIEIQRVYAWDPKYRVDPVVRQQVN